MELGYGLVFGGRVVDDGVMDAMLDEIIVDRDLRILEIEAFGANMVLMEIIQLIFQ